MDGFFPGQKYGGPPVSVNNFCSLMNDDECYIVTHNHDKDDKKPYEGISSGVWTERNNCSVMYLPDSQYSKSNFEKVINSINPDVIYLQGLFQGCILPCLQLANKHNIKVVLAPRGELCAGAMRKKYKKIPYIIFLRINHLLDDVSYQSTSEEETTAIMKYLGCGKDSIHYLTNIPSIPTKGYMRSEKKSGKGNFVFISRIHPKKNLIGAIRFFQKIKTVAVFDIYGPLEDEKYWDECKQEIEKLPSNVSVRYCGLVLHEKIHETFSHYDAFVFPTFSENYGHVIAESLMSGTPVIISDQTPWSDINEFACGTAISLDNPDGFSNEIDKISNFDEQQMQECRERIKKYLDYKLNISAIKKRYQDAFHEVIKN